MNPQSPRARSGLASFSITVNGRPYMGEADDSIAATPRHTGWTGLSPKNRSGIRLGDFLGGPGVEIIGRRNLRSHIERILSAADSGLDIASIEITRR